MLKGSDATQTLLTSLELHCADGHAPMRADGDTIFERINDYRAAVMALQTKLQKAELAETDPAIAGKFESLRGRLRTVDRIAQTAAAAVADLLRELAALEREQVDVLKVSTVAAEEPAAAAP